MGRTACAVSVPVQVCTLIFYMFKPLEVIIVLDLEHFKNSVGLQIALLEIRARFLYSVFTVSGFIFNTFKHLM